MSFTEHLLYATSGAFSQFILITTLGGSYPHFTGEETEGQSVLAAGKQQDQDSSADPSESQTYIFKSFAELTSSKKGQSETHEM